MPKKRILVVDDLPLYRVPIARALEAEGYKAVCAADGREARKILDAQMQRFDLMIVDCVMPDVDGLTFLKQVREHPLYDDIPIIMLTEVAERAIVLQSFVLGARDYVLKSCFSIPDLLAKVGQQLNPFETAALPVIERDRPTAAPVDNSPAAVLYAVRKFVERNPLAKSVQRVLSLTATEDGDGAALAFAVNAEPLLAARVLKLANSSAYSRLCRRITDLDEAISIVGFAAIRNVAVGAYFCAMETTRHTSGNSYTKRSVHVYAIARIMERLLAKRGLSPLGQLAGLCHELPETVLQLTYPQLYRHALVRATERSQPFAIALHRACGFSYQQFAAEVFQGLALPRESIDAISHFSGNHALTSETAKTLSQALRVAHAFAQSFGYSSPSENPMRPADGSNFEHLIERNSYGFTLDAAFHEDITLAKGLFSVGF